jgi:hypothetical protein
MCRPRLGFRTALPRPETWRTFSGECMESKALRLSCWLRTMMEFLPLPPPEMMGLVWRLCLKRSELFGPVPLSRTT